MAPAPTSLALDEPIKLLDPLSQMAFHPGLSIFANTLLGILVLVFVVYLGIAVGVPVTRAWVSLNERYQREEDVELLAESEGSGIDGISLKSSDEKENFKKEENEEDDDALPVFVYELAGEELLPTTYFDHQERPRDIKRRKGRDNEDEVLSSLVYEVYEGRPEPNGRQKWWRGRRLHVVLESDEEEVS